MKTVVQVHLIIQTTLEGTLCVYSLSKSEMVYYNVGVKIPYYCNTALLSAQEVYF